MKAFKIGFWVCMGMAGALLLLFLLIFIVFPVVVLPAVATAP